MNCEIFVLLEELGFVSEALNCVCSGQLIHSRVESAQCLENSWELLPSPGVCFQGPLSLLLQDQQFLCWVKAPRKDEVTVGKRKGPQRGAASGNTECGGTQAVLQSAAAAAKSLQSCLTLCDPRDGSPPGFPIPGILQARTLEWVAIAFLTGASALNEDGTGGSGKASS